MKTKDIIEDTIGTLGKWQIYIFLITCLVKFSIAWHQLGIVILAPPVEFTCANKTIDKCSNDCPSHNFDRSIFEETIVTEWDLVCDRKQLANVAQLVFMFGILFGNIIFGYLADRFGRRNPLVWAVIMQVISGIAASFSPNLEVFMLLRFFCALATGGTMLTSIILVMEIIGKKYRTVAGVLFHLPIVFGHASLGLFGYFIRKWNHFQLAISLPSIILVTYYWLIPESPRWLLTVGKTEEATEIITKAARINHLPTDSIQDKINSHLKESKQTETGGNIIDLVRTYDMRIRTICIVINWMILGFVYYGVAQFMGQISGDIFLNIGFSGLMQVPGQFLAMYMMDKIGRKWTNIVLYVLCAVSCILIAVIPSDPQWATTVLGGIGMMCIAGSFTLMYIYTGELFSTNIRNIGMGTASMFARFGSMTAPFVANLETDQTWLTPLIFGILPIIAIVTYFHLPETLNQSLPNTVEEAEAANNLNNDSNQERIINVKQTITLN